MTAYYSENKPFMADWLERLIRAGKIPAGDVDRRDIREVKADDLRRYHQCHFFAGLGGWPEALRRTALFPDARHVWTGSCPCQPLSHNGKRRGFADDRHLWSVWRDLIAVQRPPILFGEQVARGTLPASWLGLVRSDLEAMGYTVGCMPIEAACAGADHRRDRYWFVASDAAGRRGQYEGPWRDVGGMEDWNNGPYEWVEAGDGRKFRNKSGLSYVAHGVRRRVDKLRGYGNAIDPRPASAFIRAACAAIEELDRAA